MNTILNPRIKILFLTFLVSWCFCGLTLSAHESAGKNHIHNVNVNYALYQISKNDIDGFSIQTSGGTYAYPSMRDDIRSAMIARASTGKKGFEFLTDVVPSDYNKEVVHFFFYSNIDLNNLEPYDIVVNGHPLLTFTPDEKGNVNVSNQVKNSDAKYYLYRRDGNGDGVGAFRLTVPVSMIKKGEKAKVYVVGQAKSSSAWFMLVKAPKCLGWLKKAALNDVSFSIKQFNKQLLVDAPAYLVGKKIALVVDGVKSPYVKFSKQGEMAKAAVRSLAPKKSLKILYDKEVLEVQMKSENGSINENEVRGDYLYIFHSHDHNGWLGDFTKRYRPDFYRAYQPFFENKYEKGLISIMNSSHQDIAWMDRPEACIIDRDTMLITPIIKDAFARKDYGFDIEDGLMIREYIDRHPDAKEKITELLKRKLLSVGATYNCPYEDMYDGEDLVRQLYLGKRWVKKNFGGYDAKVYWNVDVPGKSMQFPQILKKAGVDYMVISRHAKGMFYWSSPDGSAVFTYSPGHYGDDRIHLSNTMENKMRYGAEQVVWWSKYFDGSEVQTPLLSSQDMLPAIDYSDYIEKWNGTDKVVDDSNKEQEIHLPHMELMTVDEYMPLAEKHATSIDTIYGERPNVWVYIHGPAHHDALSASRRASKLLPASEKFWTVASILDNEKMPYPYMQLDKAWQAKIYPDHGWGGHDGDITDNLFKERFKEAEVMGDKLLNDATTFIAQRVKTKEKKGIPIVLFNSLSWKRTDPVAFTLNFPKGKAKGVELYDAKKNSVPVQLTSVERYGDGSIKEAKLVFIAQNIPSVGYKTYYAKPVVEVSNLLNQTHFNGTYENDYYKVAFSKGGIQQVYDKELKKNLFDTHQFKVGEIFTLRSEGNGAGEFGDIQQPTMTNFDKVSDHKATWERIETGAVYSKFRLTQQIKHARVEQIVTIYHQLKRVVFEDELQNWDGQLYREFRTAYPVAISNPTIKHEVPFGTVEVGKNEIKTAGERYTPLCKDVHPRAIMDWFSANNDDVAVTLSSSVAAVDWVNPTHNTQANLLQHILLASRTSCHWEGNEYSQHGNHYYRHVLTSSKTGDVKGTRIAKQFNEPLSVVVNPERSAKATLAETMEFFAIDNKDVVVSTIKKAEDNDGVIFRMYDAEGEKSNVKIHSAFDLINLKHTNIIEENPRSVSEVVIPPYSIETYQMEVK